MEEKIIRDRYAFLKVFLMIFVPMAAFAGLLLVLFAGSELNSDVEMVETGERYTVTSLKSIITSDFNHVSSDLLSQTAHAALRGYLETGSEKDKEVLAIEYQSFAETKGLYSQVRLLGDDGMEIIRVNMNGGESECVKLGGLQDKGNRYYFKDAIKLSSGEIYVSPFDLNIENGEVERPLNPVIRFASPVTDASGSVRGIVVLNYVGTFLLNKFSQGSVASAGETFLLNRDGYYLYSPRDEDRWGFVVPERAGRSFSADHGNASPKIFASEQGQFTTKEGLYTFATTYPVAEAKRSSRSFGVEVNYVEAGMSGSDHMWKVVSFVPSGKLVAYRSMVLARYYFFYAVLALLSAAVSFLLARARIKNVEELRAREILIGELKEAMANVKTLTGLIPICAYCKKIRSEDTGYWHKVETYVQSHSDAEFTHGICDECSKKMLEEEEKS